MSTGNNMTALERIQQIEERADKATKGPWSVMSRNIPIGDTGDYDSQAEIISEKLCFPGIQIWNPEYYDITNLEFIAASRTDIPRLCAALRVAIEYIQHEATTYTSEYKESPAETAQIKIEERLKGKK